MLNKLVQEKEKVDFDKEVLDTTTETLADLISAVLTGQVRRIEIYTETQMMAYAKIVKTLMSLGFRSKIDVIPLTKKRDTFTLRVG